MGLESFPPLILVSARYFLSGAIRVGAALLYGARFPRGKELAHTALSGLLILAVGNGCLTFAETHVASGLAGLIITLSPFWFVGLEALLPGGERLHAPTIFGMVVGFAGVALLFSPGIGHEGFSRHMLIGFLILQVGIVSWTYGSIYLRRRQVSAHPVVVGAV
jgi:drug/metabolite transporter (DMT)-like permease